MRFSVQIETHLGFDWNSIRRIAEESERLGFHTLYLCDHLLGRTKELAKKSNLESWTTLAALSTITKRLHIGTLVTAVGFRQPSLLAKIASTIDTASRGRLVFGIGAGWYEAEYQAYGYFFPATSTRLEQLAEAIEIIRKMWTEEKPTYEGKHFRIREATCNPKPVQKPYPPMWVGGNGSKILQLIAAHGDGWNCTGQTLEEYREKLQRLSHECELTGRDINTIHKSIYLSAITGNDEDSIRHTISNLAKRYKKNEETYEQYEERIRTDEHRLIGLPNQILEKVDAYRKLGVEEIVCYFPTLPETESMRIWAQEILSRA